MTHAVRTIRKEPDTCDVGAEISQTLPAGFEHCSILHPARTALGSGGWQPTYAELDSAANRLAHHVISLGGGSGDRIALLMRHDTPLVASVLAVLKTGRTAVVLNPADPPSRLALVLNDADPALVLTDRVRWPLARQLAGTTWAVACSDNLFEGPAAASPRVAIAPDDVAFLIYTSGSTGRPKAVMQTHRNLMHNARRVAGGMALTADDRVALLAPLSGGHGVAMLWSALQNGAALCPFPILEKGVSGLAGWVRSNGITVYASATSVFRHFVKTLAAGDRFPCVRLVRLGSEPATADDLAAVRKHFGAACTFLHTLSSTETGNVAQLRLAPNQSQTVAAGRLPVGWPVEGVELLLRDDQGREVGPGQTGAIFVRSRYLSPGYWRNPALTAERFSGPVGGGAVRLFRTGDLGRRTAEGSLVVVGREDERVKIRGQQIDPAEVEAALCAQPRVDQAVVCARAQQNDTQLIAYVTPRSGQTCSPEALRRCLRALLPGSMIPAFFVILDHFPLTSHGKIDRAALRQMCPPPAATPTHERGQWPETETERLLGAFWAEALALAGIGRSDDFFELGGDSLTAGVVAAKVRAALGVELDLRTFVEYPTLSALSARVDASLRTGNVERLPPLVRVSRADPLPMSYAQERTWTYSRTPEASLAQTVARSHRLRGRLDADALRASFSAIVRRHEILRTTFAEENGQPVQIVHPPVDVSLPLVDLAAASDGPEQAADFLREQARRPFDLARLPLLRFWLVRIRDDEHWLLRMSHHIICDTLSWKIFFRELALLYEARLRGEASPLPDRAPLQFGDYAAWQRRGPGLGGAAYQQEVTWWKDVLSAPPPPLVLPFRRPEPVVGAAPREGLIYWGLDPDVSQRLDLLRREAGATFYMVRLAAFVAVLAAETGALDIILGTFATERSHLELQEMFGFFVNLVTLRLRCDLTCTFRAWVSTVRQAVAETEARCKIPYERLCGELKKQGLNPPEIRATFSVSDHTAPVRFGDVELTWLERPKESMPWGFVLTFDQHNEHDRCRAAFDATIYDPQGVRNFLSRFLQFLDAVSHDPDRNLSHLRATSLRRLVHD